MIELVRRVIRYSSRLPKLISDSVAIGLLRVLTWIELVDTEDIFDYDEKKEIIEEQFKLQFYTHSKYWMIPLLVICTIFSIDLAIGSNNIQLYGLMLDILGTSLLVASIVRGAGGLARDSRERAGRFGSDDNVNLHIPNLRATIGNTIDGLAGAIFLVIGFSIQSYAVVVTQTITI